MLEHVARAKARFEETTQALKSQLAAGFEAEHTERTKSP